jgi:hypothetical protein
MGKIYQKLLESNVPIKTKTNFKVKIKAKI